VKLYIPKSMMMVTDAKEDEYVPNLEDYATLKEIMELFPDFESLKKAVSKHFRKEKIEMRHEQLKDIWRDDLMPKGSMVWTFNAVMNVWGDMADNGLKAKIPFELLVAHVADEMGVEFKTAKTKVDSLIKGEFLKMEYGGVLFPRHLAIQAML